MARGNLKIKGHSRKLLNNILNQTGKPPSTKLQLNYGTTSKQLCASLLNGEKQVCIILGVILLCWYFADVLHKGNISSSLPCSQVGFSNLCSLVAARNSGIPMVVSDITIIPYNRAILRPPYKTIPTCTEDTQTGAWGYRRKKRTRALPCSRWSYKNHRGATALIKFSAQSEHGGQKVLQINHMWRPGSALWEGQKGGAICYSRVRQKLLNYYGLRSAGGYVWSRENTPAHHKGKKDGNQKQKFDSEKLGQTGSVCYQPAGGGLFSPRPHHYHSACHQVWPIGVKQPCGKRKRNVAVPRNIEHANHPPAWVRQFIWVVQHAIKLSCKFKANGCCSTRHLLTALFSEKCVCVGGGMLFLTVQTFSHKPSPQFKYKDDYSTQFIAPVSVINLVNKANTFPLQTNKQAKAKY